MDGWNVRLTKKTTEDLDSEQTYRSCHKGPDVKKMLYKRAEGMRRSKFDALTRYLLDSGMD